MKIRLVEFTSTKLVIHYHVVVYTPSCEYYVCPYVKDIKRSLIMISQIPPHSGYACIQGLLVCVISFKVIYDIYVAISCMLSASTGSEALLELFV